MTASSSGTGNVKGIIGTTVVNGPATHFAVSGLPTNIVAGGSYVVTVTAEDQANNTVAAYAGTVHFSSSDAKAVLPVNATLTNGAAVFSATLEAAGT